MTDVADPLDGLVVVLVRTRNPLNMGAVARAMQNFGVESLRVVAPFEAAFREARSAVGAAELLSAAAEYANVADAVADCRVVVGTTAAQRRELEQPLVPLDQAAATIRAALQDAGAAARRLPGAAPSRVALLFGSEKHGLTRDDLEHCHWALHIPTHAKQPSMNLAQAVAVCLWELSRTANSDVAQRAPVVEERAVAGDLDRLTQLCLEVLDAGGYTDTRTQASTRSDIRRMLLRYPVTSADAHLLMGMARKLLWSLRHAENEQP